ncbi:hypothetical protein [Nocardioides acrostichi]|uniref:Uncharacterized protein n=1 Tax=Nocardioides acrostichi TaxID=2784339 RepID=A0A930YBW3_9ACTN|nr:hypothetical protein [Nocardioides acrostichi]MBF4162893.1 hypothetical protein [Nocardioides acrostichi]
MPPDAPLRLRCYADQPARRTLQIVGDLAALLVVLLAIWLGHQANDGIDGLGERVLRVDSAASSLSSGLDETGDVLSRAPLVGDDAAEPLRRAAESSDGIGRASRDTAATIDTVGTAVGVGVTLAVLLAAAPWWLPNRIRFVVTATLLDRYLRGGGDPDLLALRALARQPVTLLVRRYPEAAAGWRAGDPDVVAALAELELGAAGLGARSLDPGSFRRGPGRPADPAG